MNITKNHIETEKSPEALFAILDTIKQVVEAKTFSCVEFYNAKRELILGLSSSLNDNQEAKSKIVSMFIGLSQQAHEQKEKAEKAVLSQFESMLARIDAVENIISNLAEHAKEEEIDFPQVFVGHDNEAAYISVAKHTKLLSRVEKELTAHMKALCADRDTLLHEFAVRELGRISNIKRQIRELLDKFVEMAIPLLNEDILSFVSETRFAVSKKKGSKKAIRQKILQGFQALIRMMPLTTQTWVEYREHLGQTWALLLKNAE